MQEEGRHFDGALKTARRVGVASLLVLCVFVLGGQLGFGQTAAASRLYAPSQVDPPDAFISGHVLRMTLDSEGVNVYWTSAQGCPGGEFAVTCVIRRKPAGGDTQGLVLDNGPGSRDFDVVGNIAADGRFVYWLSQGGFVLRHPQGALPGTSPVVVATKETASAVGQIAVDGTHVYWTENVGGIGKLFRAVKTGGPRELMATSPDSDMRQLRADGLGGVLYIADVNVFLCCLDVLFRVAPDGSGGFDTEFTDVSFVQTYTTDGEFVYFASRRTLTGALRFWAAPLDALKEEIEGIEADGDPSAPVPDTAQVPNMAVDARNLYWHYVSGPTAGGGPIFRLSKVSFESGTPTAMTTNRNEALELSSNRRFIFWREGPNIFRLPTDAPPAQLDASIANIEITQAIQNFANDVPLVQEKWTMARVYPALTSPSAASVTAQVVLHGTRNGAPLPLSPLPARTLVISTAGPDRERLGDTANFVLPPSWREGSISLTAEISVFGWFDTNAANNQQTVSATFQPKANACIKFVPIMTTDRLTYRVRDLVTGRFTPGFEDIYWRFETLWPTPRVPFYTQVVSLRKPEFLGRPQPFNMVGAADGEHIIGALWEHNVWDGAPDWCGGDNARTHYVAMVHPAIATGGTLGLGHLLEPLMWVRMTAGGGGFDAPMGGITLVHEIGHTYNGDPTFNSRWRHVNCGLPDGDAFNPNYPYNVNTIGPIGPDTYWGVDRISQRVIRPDLARDYMSYCGPAWTSDYNWRGAMNATLNLPGRSLALAGMDGSAAPHLNNGTAAELDLLHVYGRILGNESAGSIEKVYRRMDTEGDAASLPAHGGSPTGEYALELLSAAGEVLSATPILPTAPTGHGDHTADDEAVYIYFATVAFVEGAAVLRLMRDETELARRDISPNAPTVTVSQPVSGTLATDALAVEWSANDADGDPLSFVVQYSPNGADGWQMLASGLVETSFLHMDTSMLPGGEAARIRVIASDGINTGMADSPPFTLANQKPWAMISNPIGDAAFLAHETVLLEGMGTDPEDGFLPGAALSWSVTGPANLGRTGEQITLEDFPPGRYQVELTATDSGNLTGTAQTHFTIMPKRIYDGSAPVLDGYCDDPAYAGDVEPVALRYSADVLAAVKIVHTGSHVYVCFSGLLNGSNPEAYAMVGIDVNRSGETTLQNDDRLFAAYRDGAVRSGRGDGGGLVFDSAPEGVAGAVSEGDDGRWSAELRIDVAEFGGWNRLVGMQLAHLGRNQPGDEIAWPVSSAAVPQSGGATALGQLTQSIEFPVPGSAVYGDLPFMLDVDATSGLPVVVESQTPDICTAGKRVISVLAAGECALEATQPGNGGYVAAAAVVRSFTVAKAPQAIEFDPLPNRRAGDAEFAVAPVATSGLAVELTSLTPSVCIVTNGVVTLVDAGTCAVQASQSGNENYEPAGPVARSFEIVGGSGFLHLPSLQTPATE